MTDSTSEKQNTTLKTVLKNIWDWFLKSEEKLRAEENEIYEMRLDQIRAEEDAIEKYGSARFSYDGEEPEPDLHFFQIVDLTEAWFLGLYRAFWNWLNRASESSEFLDGLRKRLDKRARARRRAKALKMAELAVSGVDDAGESIFSHLPKSWQEAYLKLEDETVQRMEEREARLLTRIGRWKKTIQEKSLASHDRLTLLQERARELWEKKRVWCIAGLGVLFLFIGGIVLMESVSNGYEYSYRGRVLGTVDRKRDVLQVLDIVEEKMKTVYGSEVTIDREEDLTFRSVRIRGVETDSEDRILANLTYLHDISVYGYGIFIDGSLFCTLETEQEARAVLNTIRIGYIDENESYSEVGFAEDVTVERVAVSMTALIDQEEALRILTESVASVKVHTVETGETFTEIAEMAGLTNVELHALNPEADPDQLKVGQQLALEKAHSPLTVYTVSTETYSEEIPFDTVYIDSSSMYQGESSLKKTGKNGERTVTAIVRRENGTVVSAEELSSVATSEPVTQEVLRGTKEVPAREGTGTFIWPTTGTISSKFGMRWGRLHAGVDIANNTGTPIYAADGGTVVNAGWESSYGYIVRISHGNSIMTCYAHCSKLLVKVGEKVYQGQKIALMGSTGNSTGPHLHFEVRINKEAKDPLNYLP